MARYRDTWIDQLNDALSDLVGSIEDMVDDHCDTLGLPEVETWSLVVSGAEQKFKQIVVKYARSVPKETPISGHADAIHAAVQQELRAAQVNIEIDDEVVSKESKAMSNVVGKFLDCSG